MVKFEQIINLLSRYCDRIAQAAVMAMMILVVANILGRPLGYSIFGTIDFVGFINAILVGFALAWCAINRGHIEVEVVMNRLPQRVQSASAVFVNILGVFIFAIVTWQVALLGVDKFTQGEVSITALVPYYYFIFAMAFGCALLLMVVFINLIKSILKVVKQ
jgi:TRAP-type C4-dicarboxylate transport system permease small subunit